MKEGVAERTRERFFCNRCEWAGRRKSLCLFTSVFCFPSVAILKCAYASYLAAFPPFFYLRSSVVSSLITYAHAQSTSHSSNTSSPNTHAHGVENDSITVGLRMMPRGVGRGQRGMEKKRQREKNTRRECVWERERERERESRGRRGKCEKMRRW